MKVRTSNKARVRNPFLDPLVTELIESPDMYRRMFSEQILVGETLQLFQPANVVLLGSQGSGKSMVLNLIRYNVVSDWISSTGKLPSPLEDVNPYFGISINLIRANFHAFGRRSISKVRGINDDESGLDTTCAADFINHYLFHEFLRGIDFIRNQEDHSFSDWLGIPLDRINDSALAEKIASWDSWYGYYLDCHSLEDLLAKSAHRLSIWRSFLNANIDTIPEDIWESKSGIGDPLHSMGNLLAELSETGRLPLFVVVDQYEVLPELNKSHGTKLQRAINTLIKARDPVVFFKIGARTYDWGDELRIWGAESRIEVQRDYVTVNLSELLTRRENRTGWLFPKFARDVAYKRIRHQGGYRISWKRIPQIFGDWDAHEESRRYFRTRSRRRGNFTRLNDELRERIESICGSDASPLQLRLAGAWVMERLQRGIPEQQILSESEQQPWTRPWWRKERVGVALLQIASFANQRKIYYGWDNVVSLSGANITAFLLIASEIWDMATKVGLNPVRKLPVPDRIQSEGIFVASDKWRNRDRNEWLHGRKRYEVLGRLGPAIRNSLVGDLAISNPGHSGFSLRETEIWSPDHPDDPSSRVGEFLHSAVNWAVLEERTHTSKNRGDSSRRKWYLHPLLSPVFQIPYIRVKEPLYIDIGSVYGWIFGSGSLTFETRGIQSPSRSPDMDASQLSLKFETQ